MLWGIGNPPSEFTVWFLVLLKFERNSMFTHGQTHAKYFYMCI